MHYILDIETRANKRLLPIFMEKIKPNSRLKDPEKIAADLEEKKEEANRLMALDADYNEIICIGVKGIGEEPRLFTLEEYAAWLKEETPIKGGGSIPNYNRHIYTFNGRAFDIPVIIKNGVRANIDFPYKNMTLWTDKYKGTSHTDMMEKLQMNWKDQYKSLDTYLRIYCDVQKQTDGQDFFATATDDEIKQHCLEDLKYSEMLYLKFAGVLW